jgi:hypothetical protein
MLKAAIKSGVEYAFREKRGISKPVERVKILKHIRGNKWQAEWVDPNPGLVHFVESSQLLVRWRELKAFLKEEAAADELRRHNAEVGWRHDSPLDNALSCVFDSVGDEVSYWKGTLTGSPAALERLKARAKMRAATPSRFQYEDRAGTVYVPFDDAVNIAKRFAAAEPSTVLVNIETTERKWARDAAHGEDYIISLLNEHRAAWAVIKEWTGHDPVVAEREAEIQRLERLVWDAVYALQKAGLDRESARLRRAVERTNG